MIKRSARSGFTLLEVSLAVAVSVVLISALYVALSIQFHHARVGREVLDETTVVRGVISKISNDLSGSIGPINPFYLNNYTNASLNPYAPSPMAPSSNASGGGGSGNSSSSGGSGSGGSGSSGSSSSGSSSSGSSSSGGSGSSSSSGNSSSGSGANSNPQVAPYIFNLGVRGDENSVVFMVSKVPSELTQYIGAKDSANQLPDEPVSDLRRITYWMTDKGLARQEKAQVTYDDPTTITVPPDITDPSTYTIVAEQVTSMTIEYCNGQGTWQSTWDGLTLDTTTSLPTGPPAAIAFTFTVKIPSSSKSAPGRQVTLRHVVAIQAANRWVPLQTTGQ